MQTSYYYLNCEDDGLGEKSRFISPTANFSDLMENLEEDSIFNEFLEEELFNNLLDEDELKEEFFNEVKKSADVEDYCRRVLTFLMNIDDYFETYKNYRDKFSFEINRNLRVVSANKTKGIQKFCWPFTEIVIPENAIIDTDDLSMFGYDN